jgi:hypothetical protein
VECQKADYKSHKTLCAVAKAPDPVFNSIVTADDLQMHERMSDEAEAYMCRIVTPELRAYISTLLPSVLASPRLSRTPAGVQTIIGPLGSVEQARRPENFMCFGITFEYHADKATTRERFKPVQLYLTDTSFMAHREKVASGDAAGRRC